MADRATIAVAGAVVVMDLFGYSGGGLKTGKTGQQEQYQPCAHEQRDSAIGPRHDLSLERVMYAAQDSPDLYDDGQPDNCRVAMQAIFSTCYAQAERSGVKKV